MSLILILFSIFTTNNSQADCSKFHNIKMIQTVDDTLHYEFIDQLRIAHKKIEELRNICANNKTLGFSPATSAAQMAIANLNSTYQSLENLLPHAISGMNSLNEKNCVSALERKKPKYKELFDEVKSKYDSSCKQS